MKHSSYKGLDQACIRAKPCSYFNDQEREKMVNFLRANIDVFAWQPYDMPSIDAEVICNKLQIDKRFKSVK